MPLFVDILIAVLKPENIKNNSIIMTWLKLSKKQEPVVVQQPAMPEKESSENVVSVKLEGKIPLNAIEKAPKLSLREAYELLPEQ